MSGTFLGNYDDKRLFLPERTGNLAGSKFLLFVLQPTLGQRLEIGKLDRKESFQELLTHTRPLCYDIRGAIAS